MQQHWPVLLLFIVLMICTCCGSAAAKTDHITNGNFSSLDSWEFETKDEGDNPGSHYSRVYTGGHDGGSYLQMRAGGGGARGYGKGVISLYQGMNNGKISNISFYYKYHSHKSYYGPHNAHFDVFWRGDKVYSITLHPNGVGSWKRVEIPISSSEPGGDVSFLLSVPGTQEAQRDFTFELSGVAAMSAGTRPDIKSISVSPLSSQSEMIPAPASVTITVQGVSGDPPPQYLWIWGDGHSDTGYGAGGITHTYSMPGAYTVTLYLTNHEGTREEQIMVYVGKPLPNADFYASPTSGAVPLSVTFILTSYESGETYQWWFGDGAALTEPADSTQAQPVHSYTAEGVYSVRLIVANSVGKKTIDKTNLVMVQAAPLVDPTQSAPAADTRQNAQYSPHSVQMRFVDSTGKPLPGVHVTARQVGSASPSDWISKWFGVEDPSDLSQQQSGTTGTDGTISWLMYPPIQYQISYTYNGNTKTWAIYPHDTQYLIRVDTGGFGGGLRSGTTANFHFTPNEDESRYTLSLKYENPNTVNVTFWVRETTQNKTLYQQTFASTTMSQSYVVDNIRGLSYKWGYTAVLSDGTVIENDRGITMTRGSEPLWTLPLAAFGMGKEWYMYLAFGIMTLVGSVFSQVTSKSGAVVIALCLGPLFWFVGWLPFEYGAVISVAAGLAVVGYAATKTGDGR